MTSILKKSLQKTPVFARGRPAYAVRFSSSIFSLISVIIKTSTENLNRVWFVIKS